MGRRRNIVCITLVLGILIFGSVFEKNILPVVESQLSTTLKITKLTTGGDDTFDFTITGPTSYNSSINTDSDGNPPIGEIVILNELQYLVSNDQTIDFNGDFGIDSLVGQEVTFSGHVPTKIRIDNLELTDFPNNDAALQFRIYSNYTLGVTEFQDLVLEASSDILFANATDYEVLGDSILAQFNFTSVTSLTGTYAVSLVATNPNWFQGSEAQEFQVFDDSSLIPGDCFSVNDITNPSSVITRESGSGGSISCEDFPFKVYVQTTTNPRILWDDFRENYGDNLAFDQVFGTIGNGDHYILGNRVNLTASSILNVSIPDLNCDIATDGTVVAKIWDRPIVGSTTIPTVHATSDTWGVIANANGDCDAGGFGPNNVFDITFNFTDAPELTGEYFIGIEVDDFNAITQFDVFNGRSIAHPPVPYDPVVFMGYNATDGWIEEILNENNDEILSLRMAVIQYQGGLSGGGMGMDGPTPVYPGNYSIQETISTDWSLTGATCNDGSSSFSVDTVSGIVVNSGDNIECTFENEFVTSTDTDGDGIFDDVDTLPDEVSDDFSDVSLGGTSSGTITSRGDQILAITEESNPDGIRITTDNSGGLVPAIVDTCSGSSLIILSPGDDIIETCGSVTIDVINGSVDVIFELGDGTEATTIIPEGNSITFDEDNFVFSVPALNNDSIIIMIDDLQITLDSGSTISLGFLQINKQTTSGDGAFNFTVIGPTSYDSSIITVDGVGEDGPVLVVSGTYSIQEIIPDGWGLVDALCSDDSSTFSIDTISGIVVNAGINVECTFENEVVTSSDTDGDGILNDVDTLPDEVSDDFSDVSLGGTSSGTITTRGDQILTISEEPNPDGIRITADVSGGLLPAVVNVCGGVSIITLSPGDDIVVTCGSVAIDVSNGPVEVTFIGPGEIDATSSLTAGNSITFDPDTFSFVVPPTNSDPVVIIVDGEQVILNPGQAANVLSSFMDSFIKQGESNTNEGASTMMRIRDNGNNRVLIYFDQDKIQEISQEKTLSSATLRLYIEHNGNNWGSNGRTIDVHKLLEEWTAGDGFNDKPTTMSSLQFNELKNRGNGNGVTWKCATDTEINNQQTDCDTQWNESAFSAMPTDTITIFKDNPPTGTVKTVGWIEFDVTSDLQAFLSTEQNYGWIVKKTEEGATGLVEFTSGDSASNMPELVLVFD